jgi:hypothetical protein
MKNLPKAWYFANSYDEFIVVLGNNKIPGNGSGPKTK